MVSDLGFLFWKRVESTTPRPSLKGGETILELMLRFETPLSIVYITDFEDWMIVGFLLESIVMGLDTPN